MSQPVFNGHLIHQSIC